MNAFLKKNLTTLLIVGATLVLAIIAIFTAIKLYQTRQGSIAPNAPTSRPAAQQSAACLALTFTLVTTSPTPTPTPAPGCYSSCTTPGSQDTCATGTTCQTVGGVNRCVNPSCSENSNCICATATPTVRPTPTTTPIGSTSTPVAVPTTPSLPKAGTTGPTIMGIVGGAALILIAGLAIIL